MEFIYRRNVTVPDLQVMVERTKELMKERTPRVQLVDTLAVTGVPMEIGAILNELLDAYRSAGGKVVVMIASDQLNQMLGRSMSFGSGVQLELFDNRADALTFVQSYTSM